MEPTTPLRGMTQPRVGPDRGRIQGPDALRLVVGHKGATIMSMTDRSRPSDAAERMRLYRKRRRQGMRYVRIPLHVTEIDTLIRMGLLKGE
jgi:hypothetical protein